LSVSRRQRDSILEHRPSITPKPSLMTPTGISVTCKRVSDRWKGRGENVTGGKCWPKEEKANKGGSFAHSKTCAAIKYVPSGRGPVNDKTIQCKQMLHHMLRSFGSSEHIMPCQTPCKCPLGIYAISKQTPLRYEDSDCTVCLPGR